jgi:hypothetical protein
MSRAEPAQERLDRFVELSALLTGFGPVYLLGTGMAEAYLRAADAALPPGVLDELLGAFGRLPAGPAPSGGPAQSAGAEAAAGQAILGDAKLGPVARTLILLWYRGAWTALPDTWRSAYGTSPLDTDHVVSAEAYQAGLQWIAAGAHPAGARQQGYGAWASPPDALETASSPGATGVRVPRQAGAPSTPEKARP